MGPSLSLLQLNDGGHETLLRSNSGGSGGVPGEASMSQTAASPPGLAMDASFTSDTSGEGVQQLFAKHGMTE